MAYKNWGYMSNFGLRNKTKNCILWTIHYFYTGSENSAYNIGSGTLSK